MRKKESETGTIASSFDECLLAMIFLLAALCGIFKWNNKLPSFRLKIVYYASPRRFREESAALQLEIASSLNPLRPDLVSVHIFDIFLLFFSPTGNTSRRLRARDRFHHAFASQTRRSDIDAQSGKNIWRLCSENSFEIAQLVRNRSSASMSSAMRSQPNAESLNLTSGTVSNNRGSATADLFSTSS